MHLSHKNRIFQIVLIIFLINISIFSQTNYRIATNLYEVHDSIAYISDTTTLQKSPTEYLLSGDTIGFINHQLYRYNAYAGKAEYSKAYDIICELLPLVEKPKFADKKIVIINRLVGLYLIYNQYDMARDFHNQLPELIEISLSDENKKKVFMGKYYSLGAWIELKSTQDYIKAEELCLKSIEILSSINSNTELLHHSQIQLANIYNLMNDTIKSNFILQQLKNNYTTPSKGNYALYHMRLGEYYDIKHQKDSAFYAYSKCLDAINEFNNIHDRKPDVLKRLSTIYYNKGNYKKAYQLQTQSSALSEIIFSTQQSQNSELFQIKNKYQEKVKEQNIKLLAQENKVLQLSVYSILISAILISFLIIAVIKIQSKKAIQKQTLLNQKQELELVQQKEYLDVKNKELLESAMQLLERENENANIKKQLESIKADKENASTIKQIINDLSIDKSQKWKEFETRFTAINSDFLTSLKNKFPLLSPTDLKMCAFIKLGFTSKDMAQILGITVEGINTSRSRLRKKMDLSRETNLSEFLLEI